MLFWKSLLYARDSKKKIPAAYRREKIQLSPLERAQLEICRRYCRFRQSAVDVATLAVETCAECPLELLVQSERAAREEIIG